MRVTRLYIEQPLRCPSQLELPSALAHRLSKVMRLQSGDQCRLFNGDQYDYHAELDVQGKRVFATLSSATYNPTAPTRSIELIQAISKGDRMDFVMQKATELGVSRILPVFSQFGEVRLNAERLQKKTQQWRSGLISAAEQCGRAELPELLEPCALAQAPLDNRQGHLNLVLSPRATASMASLPPPQSLSLFIGPEGGFSDAEVDSLCQRGATAIGLGPRILRTETAALAALSVCQWLWGDFGHTERPE